ncbi:MAG: ORF6N domain-containing protein [Planctomycetota bacterium]|nr:MAG: ORF6N domain-containing protein [Planctomycetota bacterium]
MPAHTEERLPGTHRILASILMLCGRRVILDAALADYYGVSTRALIQAVQRHRDRFPPDFILRLRPGEIAVLREVIPVRRGWGGRRTPPYAFTEHGVLMLASVLRSPAAAGVSIAVVRAFVQLRELLVSNLELARKLEELERRCDRQFAVVFETIQELMSPPSANDESEKIGFRAHKNPVQDGI